MCSFCHRSAIRTNRRAALLGALAVAFSSAFSSALWSAPAALAWALPTLPALAHRTGRESCWAEFPAGEQARLCIPHRLWTASYSSLGEWRGSWRAFSPLELKPGQAKRVSYTFKALGRVGPESGSPVSASPWIQGVERRREELSEWLRLSGADGSGIFRHLLLGEDARALIPLRVLGLVHLLSASGIQLIVLSIWVGFLLGLALKLSRLPVGIALSLRSGLTGALWIWSWLLAGARVAMLRPLLLLSLRSAGRKAGLRWNRRGLFLWSALLDLGLGAFFCLLRHQPLGDELLDRGRMLYYMVAGAVLLALPRGPEERSSFFSPRRFAAVTFGAWLISATYLLAEERLIALLNPLLCFIILPLVAGVVYPLLILRSLLPAGLATIAPDPAPLLRLTHSLLDSLARLALAADSLWWVPSEALAAAAVAALALWLFPRRLRLRVGLGLAVCAALAGFLRPNGRFGSQNPPLDAASAVEQIDVGQGDGALVLEGSGNAGLIDAGSAHALSEFQWLELLTGNGLSRMDWMAATHLDEDHAGGVLTLSEVAEVGCATTSAAELSSPRGKRWAQELEARGVEVTARLGDCIPFPSLGPPPKRSRGRSANENMSAFFIPLSGGGFYLSAGDATAEAEPGIGAWAEQQARALTSGPRVLKLSHHGSKTSSNPVFLRQLAPTEAWISDGVGNSYGHPSPIVLDRVRGMGIPIHRTDEEGTLRISGR